MRKVITFAAFALIACGAETEPVAPQAEPTADPLMVALDRCYDAGGSCEAEQAAVNAKIAGIDARVKEDLARMDARAACVAGKNPGADFERVVAATVECEQ